MKICMSICLFFLIAAKNVPVAPTPPPVAPTPPPVAPTLQQLVLQWPPSVCFFAICSKTIQQRFTVHGTWPADSAGNSIPVKSCSGQKYDETLLTKHPDLKQSLAAEWPNLLGDNEGFWKLEYNRHGICSGLDQYSYFHYSVTRAWSDTHDVQHALHLAGIVPDNTGLRSLNGFEGAIQLMFGTRPLVRCVKDNGNKYYIDEVMICYEHTFTTKVNCPGNSNCRQDFYYRE